MSNKFEALKAAALAATPGPWECRDGDFDYSIRQAGSTIKYSGCEEYTPIAGEVTGGGTAAFIAAASPDVVLSLLTELKEAEQREDRYRQRWVDAVADLDVAGKRNAELERANAAQDDHINQQQDRIDTLERRNDEIGKHASKQEKLLKATEESLIASVDRASELERRLQQPIRLPHPAKANRIKQKGIGESDEVYVRGVNDGLHYSAEAIRAAGFKVEGE